MPATRKRAVTKARKGTAGTPKTARRKSPSTKARTRTGTSSGGRVKGHRGGPATREHPATPPTKRASSRRRAAEAGETLSNKRAKAARSRGTVTDADVKKIPALKRARMRDRGAEST